MNIVLSNPGFSQIAQNIIWCLDHKSQLNCRMVDQTWKAQVDQPYFWIKKLDYKGQSKDLREAWIDLAGKFEKGSYLEQELSKCLMMFFFEYSSIPESALNGIMPIHVAACYGHTKIIEFLASKVENPNPPKPNGWTQASFRWDENNCKRPQSFNINGQKIRHEFCEKAEFMVTLSG